MKKRWCRTIHLTEEAKHAKALLMKLCKLLSSAGNRKFCLEMAVTSNFCEGHIIDMGHCDYRADDWHYDPDGPDSIGMIFFGGHFSRKKHGKDIAISKAWTSLLEDSIGIGELGMKHTLTEHLKYFGPKFDLNFKSISEFETWIDRKLEEIGG